MSHVYTGSGGLEGVSHVYTGSRGPQESESRLHRVQVEQNEPSCLSLLDSGTGGEHLPRPRGFRGSYGKGSLLSTLGAVDLSGGLLSNMGPVAVQ